MDPDEFVRRVELPAKVIREASFWIDHREVGLGDLEKANRWTLNSSCPFSSAFGARVS
jgi:hypothetical protein